TSSPAVGLGNPPRRGLRREGRVAPSTVLESAIGELLSEGLAGNERLAEMGRLGARPVLQRAVGEEAQSSYREARGSRNGVRPRRMQTAEGELEVQIPQLRDTAERLVRRVIPDVRW
ncbi:MAG: transposase, partial [Candidatus Dormiibacterota bacterium]